MLGNFPSTHLFSTGFLNLCALRLGLKTLACATAIFLSTHPALAVSIAYLGYGVDSDFALTQPRVESGYDYVNNDLIPDDTSTALFGNQTAQALLGAAPNSTIVPLKVTEPGFGWSVNRGNAALSFVLTRPEIKVIDINAFQPASLNLIQQAV
ncbi:MAG: hypothetical protein V3V09_07800, partial [Arenicellales bacterium]